MSTMKNLDERVNEIAQNDASQLDFPEGSVQFAASLGIPRSELTEDTYEQYCAAFWEATRRG